MAQKTAAPKKKIDFGYTPEQIKEMQAVLLSQDFTKLISVDHTANLRGEAAKVYVRAKDIFSRYWLKKLREVGVKRMMKNYSPKAPLKFLQNADADYITEEVARIFIDPARRDAAVGQFFEMYEDQICAGLEAYCKNYGRKIEEITDEEIEFVIEKVADVLNEEFIKVLMLAQKSPEIFGISTKIGAHEDFSLTIDGNNDLINFHNKWTHCKTKLGAPLMFSELSPDEATGIEGARSFFESVDERTQKEYEELRDSFAATLNSTDREIYYLREQGYTQQEIARMLKYKSHSAVTKRLKARRQKFDEFCGYVGEKIPNKTQISN